GGLADPQHAQDAHVVFYGRDFGFGAVADKVLETFDVAVPLRALAEQDGRTFRAIDMSRSQEGRRDGIDADIPLARAFPELHEFVDRGTQFFVPGFRHRTNVFDAMPSEELEALVRGGPALAAQFHQGPFAARQRRV